MLLLTYDDGTTVNLTGAITARNPLAFASADGLIDFTIPQRHKCEHSYRRL